MKIKDMCLCALFAIFIAVGAWIKLPISIVPITMQTLFVVLASLFLKKQAVYSVLLYIGMGLIGFPVFVGGGGLSYVLVPTFGYLLGFIACSYYIGRCQHDYLFKSFVHCVIGIIMIYGLGMAYFVLIQYVYAHQVYTLSWLFYSLFFVFLPGDMISCIIALIVARRLNAYIS